MDLLSMQTLEDRLHAINDLIPAFKQRAANNDSTGRFPFENIQDLKNSNYTQLTAPREFGGGEIPLYDFVRFQEAIAIGDGATAFYPLAWHMGDDDEFSKKSTMEGSLFTFICREVQNGALLNVCANGRTNRQPHKRWETIDYGGQKW